MGTDADKEKHSKRIHSEKAKIKKQLGIAKQHGYGFSDEVIKEPHRLSKHHVMDCGNPNCCLCGNPRHSKLFKTKDKLTIQEQSFYQDKLHEESESDV